ncbi:MAG: winged helix-turn-helix domain-containing protein [Candidatus Odinarchaeota archaeon]
MSPPQSIEPGRLSSAEIESVLKLMNDPVRMYMILEITRNPGITSYDLKKRLHLSGTKVYYYLNQLRENDPPVIEELESERVSKHLFRRTFKLDPRIKSDFESGFFSGQSGDRTANFSLFLLYTAIGMLYQQVREVQWRKKQFQERKTETRQDASDVAPGNDFQQNIFGLPVSISFLDQETAEKLKKRVEEVIQECGIRDQAKDPVDAMLATSHGVIAGIYPLPAKQGKKVDSSHK